MLVVHAQKSNQFGFLFDTWRIGIMEPTYSGVLGELSIKFLIGIGASRYKLLLGVR